jgi:thiamine biosynthesis lipoprotein
MGTLVEISVIGRDEDKAAAAIGDAFAEMERIEKLMSRRIPESEISRINVPSKVEVEQTIRSVGYGGIYVDEEASTVELKRKGMRIDLGGIAKGYAVDRAYELLRSMGYRNMIVNAGGDMRVGGRKQKGPWVIGIQDPRDRSRILATLDAGDVSIATSGDYERYFEVDGIRYHHLLNPFAGFPARQCRSVTILAKDALSADALATAVFVMGPQEGERFIEAMEGVEGLIVSADGEIIVSEGLKGKLRLTD